MRSTSILDKFSNIWENSIDLLKSVSLNSSILAIFSFESSTPILIEENWELTEVLVSLRSEDKFVSVWLSRTTNSA